MAFNHISFNPNMTHGRLLRSLLTSVETSDDQFADVRDAMIQMRSGDGSSDAHYDEVVRRFGFQDYDSTQGTPNATQLAKARAAFEELDSAYSKTSGNGSVSNVQAARAQFVAKLRG